MEIIPLTPRPETEQNEKLRRNFIQFENLLNELRTRQLPADIIAHINNEVSLINAAPASEKELAKQISRSQSGILKRIEKELKLVPKNHYRNLWLALGMSTFGLPFGVVFGLSLGNMAFLGIGLPIGMAIGVALGTALDNKAEKNGTQLNLEMKH
ncbi:hypothetical protein H7F15_07750 [Pontibacter sp. Tf4]|nr:hypothetical protein [Pontibacter sp. Tf4]MBB6610925.1 hypothetical protein [Pontibacter sp. Tf4]